MNTQNIVLQSSNISRITSLTFQTSNNVLKDGDSVFVKVLSDKGNGVYEGSVAGHRVHITSSKGLEVGSSFVASITSKNGTIYISPKDTINVANQNPYIQINTVEGNALQNLLANLGVPVNQLSSNILKMMMMNDMKIDGNSIRNIFTQSSKFKGKEKLASELLILLKNKGIEASREDIEALLSYLEQSMEDDEESSSNEGDRALINNINKKEEGWTLIPYNLVDRENNNIIGKGVIRLLFNKYKDLKKIALGCFYNDKEYLFNLNFISRKLKEVKFNINPISKNESYYIKVMNKIFNKNGKEDVKIQFTTPSCIEGCGSEGEKIYSFEGEA